ncbi:hypothetical protein J5N97_023569 [Dioscorea zingiberensis]|uniref:Nonsense-mediated mRNA decay factor SMG8 n=1 Tax=Dioscorea zingiberensis TaxID=325984 RepID=A0A9D5C512_9LILI|nr:hypothetical protein J5N97_023569 [Dioscorea zingiberensis]
MEAPKSSSSPVRFLIRPSPPSSAATATSSTPPTTPAPSSPSEGVVVVGFVGAPDAAHLINRILDANVFGSGNLAKDLASNLPEITFRKGWFQRRRISYHHDEEKGLVFLHFSSASSLIDSTRLDAGSGEGLASVLEEREADDLRGMLLMFLVCHVIVFLHEGMRFDTNILKKLRMLQAAKHALGPYVRSQVLPTLATRTRSSSPQPIISNSPSVSPPPRHAGASSRHASAISLMSGSGSYPSVLPGQCTPVILFVFIDDFSESSGPVTNGEDTADASLLNQSSNVGGISKQGMTLKGSGSVLMLARSVNKTEGGFRKKLHSSLETQLRFLIKKCRTLVGADSGHLGVRGAANLNSLPLFSLDTSRVVALLDSSCSQRGESLDFVTSLIEDALDSKTALDMLMLENHCQNVTHEDVQMIKDFLQRQSDALRGRGGLPSNANSGSVSGVGIVAAAAAAAAASVASGKTVSAPELPSLENWLTSTSEILDMLLSVKYGFVDENEKTSHERFAIETRDEKSGYKFDAAVSLLESSKGLNMRFSVSWCQKALPAAKEVYLKDLPACYPTALHNTQLEKALNAFHSMVKGPAVKMFAEKLENECLILWESGRQLCDAVSLTGKPCMHQRHNTEAGKSPLGGVVKQHSSGFIFLHACACGRSRHMRDDPFDFESANVSFNCFANCEDLLPTLILPKGTNTGPLPHNSWRLVRLGGAKYYKPIKGLLQVGFCSTEKFLLKWTMSFEKQSAKTSSSIVDMSKIVQPTTIPDPKTETFLSKDSKNHAAVHVAKDQPSYAGSEKQKSSEMVSFDNSVINFGKGFPSFNIKKPFAEVVAGTNATNSNSPILQQRKQPKVSSEKGKIQPSAADRPDSQVQMADDRQGSQRTDSIFVQESLERTGTNGNMNGDPFLQIGSNIVPVNLSAGGKIKPNDSLQQVIVYIGFEHECSYGHRFLLSPKHLNELETQHASSENSHSSAEDSERNFVQSKNISPEKVFPNLSGIDGVSVTANKSTESTVDHSQQHEISKLFSKPGMEKFWSVNGASFQSGNGPSTSPDSVEDIEGNLLRLRLDDGQAAFSFLNRNLPIYMNCPHCRKSKRDSSQKIKFASTLSQLQRIFIVTPAFPTVLAISPVIQFKDSCLPESITSREQQSRFSLGCQVILPPESFLTLRLPFVYGVQMGDGNLHPLKPLENQPELSAWLVKGTTLQLVSAFVELILKAARHHHLLKFQLHDLRITVYIMAASQVFWCFSWLNSTNLHGVSGADSVE